MLGRSRMAEQGKTSFIVIPLVLTLIFAVTDSIRASQRSWSSYCAAGAAIVNCSYCGIVYTEINYNENFTCPVCCNTGFCCQVSTNITLRLSKRLNGNNKIASVVSNEPVHQPVFASEEEINSSTSFNGRLAVFEGFNGSNNNFRELPCFDKWVSLEWVDLSNNFISYLITPFCFENLSVLTTLNLKNNILHVIIPTVFIHLKGLRYLYLNNNPTITDWSFLNESVHMKVVDIRGSCNKSVPGVSNLSIPCVQNMSVIHDNSTCVLESVDKNGGCNLSVTWPTTSYALKLTEPCESIRPLYLTSPIISVTNTEQGSTTKNQIQTKPICVIFANTTFDFLSSGKTCIWFPFLILVACACGIFAVVSLRQRRALTKYQDKRYSRWLFKYSPQCSKNENGLQMQCNLEEPGMHSVKYTCASTSPLPSEEQPTVPVASNDFESLEETEIYSECYDTIKESSTSGNIFLQKDMCMIVNLRIGLVYNRWMGTIALPDDSSKCVVFTTVTDTANTLKNKTIHWDEYIKRALDLPKNKYLIHIEGTVIDEETVYLVQEHLNCQTLEVRLKNFNICPTNASNALMMITSEVMRHILGILEGLELLQSYGFLHPGLSAKKVLLTNRGICKLYDFCLVEDAGNIVSVKKTQMVCGRNQFAPEALIRNKYIKASDVWSAANLIWEILSGSVPFSADAETIIDQDPAMESPKTWPEKYEALRNDELFECWRLDPSVRPTMSELRSSFHRSFDSYLAERTYSVSSDTNAGYMPMNRNVYIDGTYGIETNVDN